MTESYSQLESLAETAGFTSAEAPLAAAIALAESSGNPDATHANTNGSTDRGLWQINSAAWPELSGDWSDPQTNANWAYYVYTHQGWNAWTTYTSGAYEQYLNGSSAADASDITGQNASFTSTISGAGQLVEDATHVIGWMVQPRNWERVLLALAGVTLAMIGAISLARNTGLGKAAVTAAGTAGKVAAL